MILAAADIWNFIKDNLDPIIAILGLFGVTSFSAVLIYLNYIILMNPIRFTFEEIDRRDKYIFLNPLIKTVLLVLLVPISTGSGPLLVLVLYKNMELDTNEILTNIFFSGLSFLVLSFIIFFLIIIRKIIISRKKILFYFLCILKAILYFICIVIAIFLILFFLGFLKVHTPFIHFDCWKQIYTVIKKFDYKNFKNYINIKDYINIIIIYINIINICINIYVGICILVFTIFIFLKKVIHPFINFIKKNILFIKILDICLFHLGVSFIFLYSILYIYEKKINISKKNILFFYILYAIVFFIYIFGEVYSNYSSRVNLSYLYYLDGNGKKIFIFSKTNDMWICSKKDYILCSKKEKIEFYNKTSEYRNKAKKVNDSKVKEKILEYIDKIDKHSEYIRVDTPEVLKYFVILNYCIENVDINSKKVELYKTIKKIIKMTEIKLIDQSDIPKDKLYPHTDNKDKFYSLLIDF